MRITRKYLEQSIFADDPINWYLQAQGFHHAAMQLITAIESPVPNKKYFTTEESYLTQFLRKIVVYLLPHSIELLLKSIICGYNKQNKSEPLKPPQNINIEL